MKKKLLLMFILLAGIVNMNADNGKLSIANVKNAVPGYIGSFDVVITGSTQRYCGVGFKITLPTNVTYSSHVAGNLIGEHTVSFNQDAMSFQIYSNPVTDFTADNGILITIFFTVTGTGGTVLDNGVFTDVSCSINNNNTVQSVTPSTEPISITIANMVTLSEDDTTAPVASSSEVDVAIHRTLKADMWNTIVLPFNMSNDQLKATFGNDVQLGSFNGYTLNGDNIRVNFTSSETLTAHTPYIIKVSTVSDDSKYHVGSVNISAPTNNLTVNKGNQYMPKSMIGSYVPMTVPDLGLFISNNQFKYSKGNSTIKGFRAYFIFANFDYNNSGSRSVSIDFFDMSTNVHSVSKIAGNDNRYYDLRGQRMDQPIRKGIYVKKGKTVSVK
jgi:hypothetical protein